MKDITKKVHKAIVETDKEYSKRINFSVLMDYEELCEALVGDDAMKTHSHQDILAYINELKNTRDKEPKGNITDLPSFFTLGAEQ